MCEWLQNEKFIYFVVSSEAMKTRYNIDRTDIGNILNDKAAYSGGEGIVISPLPLSKIYQDPPAERMGGVVIEYNPVEDAYIARAAPGARAARDGYSALEKALVRVLETAQGVTVTRTAPSGPDTSRLTLLRELARVKSYVYTHGGGTETVDDVEANVVMRIPRGKLRIATYAFKSNGWDVDIRKPIVDFVDSIALIQSGQA